MSNDKVVRLGNIKTVVAEWLDAIRAAETECLGIADDLESADGVDIEKLAIGSQYIQTGFLWLERAVRDLERQ